MVRQFRQIVLHRISSIAVEPQISHSPRSGNGLGERGGSAEGFSSGAGMVWLARAGARVAAGI